MIAELIAFAGSATVRWILGEGIDFMKKRSERKQELEALEMNHKHDRERRQWNLDELKAAHVNQIELVREQGAGRLDEIGAMMQKAAVESLFTKSGVLWVDGWNGAIRPFLATCAIILICLEPFMDIKIDEATKTFLFSALGLFVGGRIQRVGR
jgi:stage V sporulation protein SpoVS